MVFIPRWERYRDKKPSEAVEIDWNNSFGGLVTTAFSDSTLANLGPEGGDLYWFQKNPSSVSRVGDSGVYIYADNGGPDDDELKTANSIPTFRGTKQRTLLLIFSPEYAGNALSYIAHQLAKNGFTAIIDFSDDSFTCGYNGLNGYYYYHTFPAGTIKQNKRNIVTLSIDVTGKNQNVVINGVKASNVAITSGNKNYIGNGTVSTTSPLWLFYGGYTNYYGYRGQIELFSYINEFYSESELLRLHESPYQILKPRRRWFVFGSGTSEFSLFISNISQNNAVDNISLTQQNTISTDDLNHSVGIDEIALSQQSNVIVSDIAQNNAVDSVTLTNQSIVNTDDITQNNDIDNVLLSSNQTLIAENIAQTVDIINITLTQQNTISTDELNHDVDIDNVELSNSQQLSASNITQSSSIESIIITQQNNIVVSDMSQAINADNVLLNIGDIISISNINHSNAIDNIALTQAGNLIIDDVNQSNSTDNIALIQSSVLSIDAVLSTVTVDNLALDFSVFLDVNNTNQSISIDNIVLTQAGLLSIAGLLHNNTIDNIALTQQSTLIVSDVLHEMLSDNINLIDGVISLQTNIGTVFMLKSEHNVFTKGDSSPVFIIRG